MNDGVLTAPAERTWRWWDVLRLAVVLLWLLAAATTWWTMPRKQSYDQARADVAAGRVTAYQWGERWEADSRSRWFNRPSLRASDRLGPLFVWSTPAGRVYWTDTNFFDEVITTGAVDPLAYSGPGAVGIAQEVRAAGLEHRAGVVRPSAPVVVWTTLVLVAVFLGVVIAGPAPVRGTRWFWFWLVAIAPYGLGLLYWLARDRPWSRPAAPAATLGAAESRDRGFLGFGIGLLSAFLIDALLLILHPALGDWWVPRPG